jgi:5'-methylthioadenosine nucleosidase
MNAAVVSAFVALTELNPDIVINAGTAGGFQRGGAKIGDAFASTMFCHHDRRIPIPGFADYGRSSIPSFICDHLVQVRIPINSVTDLAIAVNTSST